MDLRPKKSRKPRLGPGATSSGFGITDDALDSMKWALEAQLESDKKKIENNKGKAKMDREIDEAAEPDFMNMLDEL